MKSNFFLFFSVFSLLSSISRAQTFCNGVYCNANCTNCYPCNQEVNCFKAKGCFCASKTIPGNLPWANTPQFVFFTLDDSIRSLDYVNCMQNLSFILNNPNITDSMGCNPKLSAYVMGYRKPYFSIFFIYISFSNWLQHSQLSKSDWDSKPSYTHTHHQYFNTGCNMGNWNEYNFIQL